MCKEFLNYKSLNHPNTVHGATVNDHTGSLTGCLRGSEGSGVVTPTLEAIYLTLRLKIAQKSYIVWSLGPKALKYESLEP